MLPLLAALLVSVDLTVGRRGEVRSLLEDTTAMCDVFTLLTPLQRRTCHEHMPMFKGILRGSTEAMAECEKLFHNEEWTCDIGGGHLLDYRIEKATRRQAFMTAMQAIAIGREIFIECVLGRVAQCACHLRDETRRDANCVSPYAVAKEETLKFFAAGNQTSMERRLLDTHNRIVGLRVMEKNVYTENTCNINRGCNPPLYFPHVKPLPEELQMLKTYIPDAKRVKMDGGLKLYGRDPNFPRRQFSPDADTLVYMDEDDEQLISSPEHVTDGP